MTETKEKPHITFSQSLACTHQTFTISSRDKRVKQRPEGKNLVHVCEELGVWRDGITFYFWYEKLTPLANNNET